MKNIKILKFKLDDTELTINKQTGFYDNENGSFGHLDLLGMDNLRITSIKDENRNLIVSIGDRRTKTISITEIYFMMNKAMVAMTNGAVLSIQEFTHYKEPIIKEIVEEVKQINKPVKKELLDQIKQIEDKILQEYKEKPIRLEKTLLKTAKQLGLEKFLVKFFKDWNLTKDTIYTKDKTVQTVKAKRRSLGDIYMICKYYFPECTLKEVLNLLYNKLDKTIVDGFRTSSCHKINKRVWYYDTDKGQGVFNKEDLDEYGYDYNYYVKNSK